jgi:tetratricopeptide (TPR) repeat protein
VLQNLLVSIDLKAGGVDAALATADALAKEPVNQPAAAALRGNIYYTLKRYEDAAAAYTAAMQANPSPALALNTALTLNVAGHPDQATKLLRDWIASNPDDVASLAALASLDIAARRLDDGQMHLQSVLAKRPNDPTTLNNLAWVYQQKNDNRARPLAQRAYLLSPQPQTADTLGWILTTEGHAAQALPLLRQALSGLQTEPGVAYHYAVALKDTGARDEAMKLLKALASTPGNFEEKPAATKLLEELSAAPK